MLYFLVYRYIACSFIIAAADICANQTGMTFMCEIIMLFYCFPQRRYSSTNVMVQQILFLLQTGCPKKMYTHKVKIPYYNVYTSFWDTLYTRTTAVSSYRRTAVNHSTLCTPLQKRLSSPAR
jgi:hypothetical protein